MSGLTVKRVLTARREDCVLAGDIAVTDAQGSFDFERRYEFRAVVPLYGDPVDPMVLCMYRDGEVVGSAKSTLMGGAPKEMELECDLELLRVRGQEVFCGPPSGRSGRDVAPSIPSLEKAEDSELRPFSIGLDH